MKLPRRTVLQLAAAACALPGLSRSAWAQTYPARAVRIVTTFPAGGTSDLLIRPLAQWLQERLGQSFIVESRPGAGGTIGTEAVVRASPDGYTLLLVAGAHMVNATLYDRLSYNFMRDITPVAGISRETGVMLVHPSVPANTVPEFIAHARGNPGKLNMASSGIGSTSHVAGELFKMMTGVNVIHVPYRGSPPALTDLLSGEVQLYFANLGGAIGHIRAGRLRVLAVNTATRSETLPDVPTVGEFVPGYEASSVWGLGAPRHTPTPVIDLLNREINAALADPKMKTRFAELGGAPLAGPPAEFAQLIADETANRPARRRRSSTSCRRRRAGGRAENTGSGRSAARSGAADPGPLRMLCLERSRIGDAALRAASRPGHESVERVSRACATWRGAGRWPPWSAAPTCGGS
jgi:tripartite-type tricarboxylate transporter receptor subunit TctC